MSDPQNNFLIFNEANSEFTTMSDADYASDLYRINGLIPMIADPIAHNKMFRQWSIMAKAIADMICDKGYDALDTSASDLKNNLKTAVKGLARDELSTEITTLGNIDTWKESITATPAELNTLDGITASTAELNILDGVTATASEINILDGVEITTTELNYLDGASSNIQTQINNLSIGALFPLWIASRAYSVGDVVKTLTSSFWVYLECVVAGTSDTTEPTFTNVGELVTDGTVKWLVLDLRDSAPVGTFKTDIVQRLGWLKANGATLNRADYPRLWAWAVDNNLTTNDTTNNPGLFGEGDGVDTFELPNFEDYFIRYSYVRGVGTKQDSQMASHSHSCSDQDTSHTHTLGNQSANHKHKYTYCLVAGVYPGPNAGIQTGTSVARDNAKEATTGNQDTSHTHSIGNQTANHKHTIGSTGSGSNTYPDNIAMQMYIKY